MASKEEINDIIKEACQPGGMVHTLMIEGKDKKHEVKKDGVAGLLNMRGSQFQPQPFENEVKSDTLFRHWNDEVRSYLKIVDPCMLVLLNVAESNIDKKITTKEIEEYLIKQKDNIIDADKHFEQYLKDNEDSMEKMYANLKNKRDEELHTLLMFMLKGEAKEMCRNASPSGMDAWRALNHRWNRKTQFGATQISEMIRKITPAKSADDVFTKMNQLERLHLELQKNLGDDIVDGKAVKVHYGEAFKKADMLRVLNEEFNTQLKKEGEDLENMTYQKLKDKVQAYVRINSKGKAHMEIGMLNMNIDEDMQKTDGDKEYEPEKSDTEEEWNEHWVGYVGYKGYDKGKGKGGKGGKSFGSKGGYGKGGGKFGWSSKFEGTCHACGKYGHRQADCHSKGNAKGFDNKGFGKGAYQKGKGNVNNFGGQEDMFAVRPQPVHGYQGQGQSYGCPPLMQMVGNDYREVHHMCHLEHKDENDAKRKEDGKLKRKEENGKVMRDQSQQHRKNGTQTQILCAYAGGENALALCSNPVNIGETMDFFEILSSGKVQREAERCKNKAEMEKKKVKFAEMEKKQVKFESKNPWKALEEDGENRDEKYFLVESLANDENDKRQKMKKRMPKFVKPKVMKKSKANKVHLDGEDKEKVGKDQVAQDKKQKSTCHDEKDKKERSMINLFEHKKTETNENVLNAVEGDGWEFMSVLIDSGSTETVTSSDTLAGYEMVSTDWSESGKGYSAANGTDIPNLGEKVVQGQAANGMWCTMRFQICNVTKPLGSVSRICQAGSRVVFGPPEEGSYIEHVTTRKKTWLRQCKGLYYLDMWIAPATVFTRPGKM